MVATSRDVSQDAGWRLRALLRCRRLFVVSQLVLLYKAQSLSFIKLRTSALYHATPCVLNRIDRVHGFCVKLIWLSWKHSDHLTWRLCLYGGIFRCWVSCIESHTDWHQTLCRDCFRDKSRGNCRRGVLGTSSNLVTLCNKAAIPMCTLDLAWD